MGLPAFKLITVQEYLESEINAVEKHEFFDGEVFAMAGASEKHNRVVVNLTIEIGKHLKGKSCTIYPSDMRVATPQSDAYMYPDLSIVCGEIELKENIFDTLMNPSVIIEVMSPTTKVYDSGYKFFYYKQIPSLKEYIIIDPTQYFVAKFSRQIDNSWNIVETEGQNASIMINTIELEIPFDDIYYRVKFDK